MATRPPTLVAARWPFCATCQRGIKLRWNAGWLLVLLVADVWIFVFVVYSVRQTVGLTVLIAGLTLLGLASVVIQLAGEGRYARGELTRDGAALRLRAVSEEFAAALPATARSPGSPRRSTDPPRGIRP